jgi:hypothetical protein
MLRLTRKILPGHMPHHTFTGRFPDKSIKSVSRYVSRYIYRMGLLSAVRQ